MLKHTELEPRFVKGVPRELEPGVLYVSMEYATVVHSCCCGCGLEVVTQLSPTHWELNFNGEAISLWPSVGNWNLPCQSHYVIRRNKVLEGEPWSPAQIRTAYKREKAARDRYYGQSQPATPSGPAIPSASPAPPSSPAPQVTRSFASWIARWLK